MRTPQVPALDGMTPLGIAPDNSHVVVYRTGGPAACEWKRSVAMSYADAVHAADVVMAGGRKALVVKAAESLSRGLPTGWTSRADQDTRITYV